MAVPPNWKGIRGLSFRSILIPLRDRRNAGAQRLEIDLLELRGLAACRSWHGAGCAAGTDYDDPPEGENIAVPQEQLDELQPGLVSFVEEHKLLLPELVSEILPADSDVADAWIAAKQEAERGSWNISAGDLFSESLLWLQWLMFEDEPHVFLNSLSQKAVGQRAVCGAVWGHRDLAYRCRTCEHDPTCAICVPCFQNGNHKDHDYSIIYTGGGCCDCGDVTAWKREGFCSKHKGVEQVQPLPEEIAGSAGPVIDALLVCWKERLLLASNNILRHHREGNNKYANELSSMVVGMLLEFCNCSESLLNFIAKAFLNSVGLLDILVRAEIFLDKSVVKKLHELLLKLLGEPLFKYEFAKVFIRYYPTTVNEIIKDKNDSTFDKYPLLQTFSVQIFTVPTLTPRLVREVNLLAVLLECLSNLFRSCVGADGCLEANKWANMYETTIRLVEDIRYVMSHDEVPRYIARECPDISKLWIKILELVHSVDPQKRVTGLHTEEENENLQTPFMLGHYLGNVQSLLVEGAFLAEEGEEIKSGGSSFSSELPDTDDGDRRRHAKVGRLSQESSVSESYISSRSTALPGPISAELDSTGNHPCIPPYVASLFFWCMKSLDRLLASEVAFGTTLSPDASNGSGCNILSLRGKFLRPRKEGGSSRFYRSYSGRNDQLRGFSVTARNSGISIRRDLGTRQVTVEDIDSGNSSVALASDVSSINMDTGTDPETLSVLSIVDWPEIVYDVSSQEISFHIPLHRLLTLLFQKAMSKCYGNDGAVEKRSDDHKVPLSAYFHDFFQQILRSFHPSGFSAFVMEHPLRLRVFCAQVRAGMWRKNGDAGILISEWYRAVVWFDIGIESDLFLLQCCAALAPAELFVKRIQERFGLLNYLSLDLAEHSEYVL
ncbi:hypothetical protein Taro_033215 [Colocasia esculenta]|uniref:E3 ubiquitin-protein ligase n=1 Tax=Colocasia esculenta TaxID=4460 RepID=A0A843VTB2_COLES|nr:hypothetical protein [Colocasia esculenta]